MPASRIVLEGDDQGLLLEASVKFFQGICPVSGLT